MSTSLISIERDVLINDILDQLSVPDLIHVLESDKTLYSKYAALFEDKIEDYRHRKQEAIPKYMANIERMQQKIGEIDASYGPQRKMVRMDVTIIDPQLSRIMGIEHLPQINKVTVASTGPRLQIGTLYNHTALEVWLTIYMEMNNLNRPGDNILINEELATLTGLHVDYIYNRYRVYDSILYQHTQPALFAPSPEQIAAIQQEYLDLLDIYNNEPLRKSTQARYPSVPSLLP